MTTGYSAMDEICEVYCVTIRYAYRLASIHHWGRYRHPDGGVRYRREDVDATLAEGAATRRARQLARRSTQRVKSQT